MRLQKNFLIIIAFLLLSSYCLAAEIEDTTPIQSIKATVTLSGEGEITGNLQGRNAEIRLFSFRENNNQEILNQQETLSINGRTIYATREQDGQGNNYAVFRVNETGAFTYKIEAMIETNYQPGNLQEYDLSNKITQFAEFTAPTEKVESTSETIRTIALNNFDSNSWLQTIRDVTNWVHGYVTYDKSYYPAIKSAIETLDERRGTCDEFSILAAAMLRARGIPVRFASGVSYGEGSWGNHAWIDAFNPESGWIAIDPTFGEAGLIDGTHFFIG
ncbi:MAG: transglutaminase domain-containing protein, partial [Candidatus Diapherotrites archaeon]|nr:transglutaminase domain-containing protein [Candidatus Diapherotrites archaeon]